MFANNKTEGNVDFLIDQKFEKQIQSFFEEVLSFPLHAELIVLSNELYGGDIDANSMAELRLFSAEDKTKTLKSVTEKTRYRVYVIEVGSKVNIVHVMREFLKAYYPNVATQTLIKAAEVFADTYRCYVRLFDEADLRIFFVRLCVETDTIFKWTGLPKQL